MAEIDLHLVVKNGEIEMKLNNDHYLLHCKLLCSVCSFRTDNFLKAKDSGYDDI